MPISLINQSVCICHTRVLLELYILYLVLMVYDNNLLCDIECSMLNIRLNGDLMVF